MKLNELRTALAHAHAQLSEKEAEADEFTETKEKLEDELREVKELLETREKEVNQKDESIQRLESEMKTKVSQVGVEYVSIANIFSIPPCEAQRVTNSACTRSHAVIRER